MAAELNAARVQSIGKVFVLYRPLPEEEQARRAARAEAAARIQARSPKASAAPPTSKKTAGNAGASTRPGRRDIRASNPRTSAPRKATASARGRAR
jgi:hypothetical protein